MRAIILAAGLGTRLRPITNSIPKCMVPIHGKPLLSYWLDLLLNNGVDKLLINTHYLPNTVRSFVADSEWVSSISLVHEDQLLGTGGTILKNRTFSSGQSLMVVHADNLTRFKPLDFITAHLNRSKDCVMTMMTFDTDVPKNCGIVKLDERGVVQEFHEKVANPPGTRANAAVYIIEPVVIDFIASLGKEICDFSTEVLPNFLGKIQTFHNTDYHRDIGNLESLALAEIEF
jgi:mannose-1-phosphate guanylyltransferase